jgi:ketosteroid isomerase-like protein
MWKTERNAMRKLPNLRAASALMLTIVAICHAQAPPAPGGGRGPGLRLPQQGFEATGQVPANYTPEEAAAVAVVRKWVETSNAHDVAAHMALIDDNIVHRGDPTEGLAHGARSYCQAFGFVRSATSVLRIDELYVVGGAGETLVLMKRTDINNPAGAGRAGGLSGYPVPLAVLVRVKNGKVTEWLDAPINKVSMAPMRAAGALPNFAQPAAPAQPRPVPEVCMKYPEGSK